MTEPTRDPEDVVTEPAPTDRDVEAPDADAAEQSVPVDHTPDPRPSIGLEVDEYDAVEQSRVVEYEEEYR